MDPTPDIATRRLFISAALSAHAARSLKGRIPFQSKGPDLLALARRLTDDAGSVERRYGLRFEPPFPGVTGGVESVGDGVRLVLACAASQEDGTPFGVVFTALIPGRPPQVSVAPAAASIPQKWRPLADFL